MHLLSRSSFVLIVMLFVLTFIPEIYAWVPDAGPGKCVGNCGSPDGDSGSRGGSQTPTYNYEAERQRQLEAAQRAEGHNLNEEGVRFFNEKNWAKAVEYFKKALQKWPENKTMQRNFENAKEALRQETAEKERQQKEAQTAERMRGSINQFSSTLNTQQPQKSSGLDFESGKAAAPPSSGGLNFMSAHTALDEAATNVHETKDGLTFGNTGDGQKPKGTKFFNKGGGVAGGGTVDTSNDTKAKAGAVFDNAAKAQSSGISPKEDLKNVGKRPIPSDLPANLGRYKNDKDIQRWLRDKEQAVKDYQKLDAQLKVIEEDKKNGRGDPEKQKLEELNIRDQRTRAVSKENSAKINIKERVDFLQGLDLTKKPAKPPRKEPPSPATRTEHN